MELKNWSSPIPQGYVTMQQSNTCALQKILLILNSDDMNVDE